MTNVTTRGPRAVAYWRQVGGAFPPSIALMGRKVTAMAAQKVFTQDDWNVIRSLIVSSGLLALAQAVAEDASAALGDKVTISQVGGTLKFMRHEETWTAPAPAPVKRAAAPVKRAPASAPASAPADNMERRMTNLENAVYAFIQSSQAAPSPDELRERGKSVRAAARALPSK